MRNILLLFPLVTILTLVSNAQKASDIESKLDAYLNSANNAYRFNGVALVIYKDSVILNKGYGFSDLSLKAFNTPDTRFPILSLTKTITSTVILKLQDEKKLSVKDKLVKYFPDYPNGSKITIHHLLTHSSGLHNYTEDVSIEDSAIVNYPIPKERVINQFRDKPVDFPPGKYYSYNNSGYFLLGLIIEKVTGKPYETVVKEYIFEPLGMKQSGFDFINLPKTIRAQGYEFWNDEKTIPYKHYDSTFAYSAGSIFSTGNDMLKWAKAVAGKQILNTKTWELAFKPQIKSYGYGWQTGQFFGNSYVKHSGGYPGFMSEFIYYPDKNLIIVLLNNFGTYGQNIWAVGMGLTSIVLGLPYDIWKLRKEVVVANQVLQSRTGVYTNGKNRIEFKLNEGKLFILITGLPEMQLYSESDKDFFLKDYNASFHFDNDLVTVREHGQDSQWQKKR